MTFQYTAYIDNTFIELFNKHSYEGHVCEIINLSKRVFPGIYEEILTQSKGECDFIEASTKAKFDAKLPFTSKQVEMLVSNSAHIPDIKEWIEVMTKEALEYDLIAARTNPPYDITDAKLYK